MIFSLLRQMQGCISKNAAYYSQLTTPIPGLHIYHDFLETDRKCDLQKEAIKLHHAISSDTTVEHKKIHRSQSHNLPSHEYYRLVSFNDQEKMKITCQYFEKYGEDGHKLTYFIGNNNLPNFIKSMLISRVLEIPEVIALSQNKLLNWNLTFNVYASELNQPRTEIPGFPFHKDIPSNGEATMIYSIGAGSEFQMRHPANADKIHAYPLYPNSLILFSKEARWDYEHRVVPVEIVDSPPLFTTALEKIWRISLVLGFK